MRLDFQSGRALGSACDGHVVQFYGADDDLLVRNVALYVDEALSSGGGAAVIATRSHREALLQRLSSGATRAIKAQRLLLIDADETLESICIRGFPNAARFDDVVGSEIRALVARCNGARVNAFGEMVGILWAAGWQNAAARLENLWNRLRSTTPFNLYCAYPIDVFDSAFDPDTVQPLLCTHTSVHPALSTSTEEALRRAVTDVLGAQAVDALAAMPSPEALILWVRKNYRAQAEQILWQARCYYADT